MRGREKEALRKQWPAQLTPNSLVPYNIVQKLCHHDSINKNKVHSCSSLQGGERGQEEGGLWRSEGSRGGQ